MEYLNNLNYRSDLLGSIACGFVMGGLLFWGGKVAEKEHIEGWVLDEIHASSENNRDYYFTVVSEREGQSHKRFFVSIKEESETLDSLIQRGDDVILDLDGSINKEDFSIVRVSQVIVIKR